MRKVEIKHASRRSVVLWRPGQTSAKALQCYISRPWVETLFKKALASVEGKPALLQRYEKDRPISPHEDLKAARTRAP